MDQQEWNTLYRFLLAELRDEGLTEVATEVEDAATARIVEHNTTLTGPTTSSRRRRPARRSVERGEPSQQPLLEDSDEAGTLSRAPTSSEAFQVALDVLRTRLVDLPALLQALPRLLGTELNNIEWRPDILEGSVAAESETILGAAMIDMLAQQNVVSDAFHDLESMSREADL